MKIILTYPDSLGLLIELDIINCINEMAGVMGVYPLYYAEKVEVERELVSVPGETGGEG